MMWRKVGGIIAGIAAHSVIGSLINAVIHRILWPDDRLTWVISPLLQSAQFIFTISISALTGGWVAGRIGRAYAAPIMGAILALASFLWLRNVFFDPPLRGGALVSVGVPVPAEIETTFFVWPPLLFIMSIFGGWLALRKQKALRSESHSQANETSDPTS